MRRRRLGRAGPELSVVGFGAWAIGGPWRFGWGQVDDDQSVAAVRRAIELGVNWVDTAAVYGLGHSEEVVGRALGLYRVGEDVLVFTKCGRRWRGAAPDGSIENDLRPESIREVRAEPAPARRRTDRSLPGALARLDDRDVDGGVLGHDGRARGRGEGSLDRRLQLRRRPARALRGRAPRRLGPAAAVAARARRALHRRAVGGGARRRGCSATPRSPPGYSRAYTTAHGSRASGRMTGAARRLPSGSRSFRRISSSSSGSGRSPRGSARRSRPWLSRGCWHTPVSRGQYRRRARLPGHVDGWVAAAGLELDDQTLREIGEAIAATGAGSDVPPAPLPHIRAVPDRT